MTFEIYLVTGCVLAMLSSISILSAWIDGHPPRVAAIAVVISGGLILKGILEAEGGFQLLDIPEAFVSVIAMILKSN